MKTDKYGRKWPCPEMELCPVCSQPDSCGDCDHEKLSAEDVVNLGGELECNYVTCSLCGKDIPEKTAHIHQGEWIGDDCCWDERLRSSE